MMRINNNIFCYLIYCEKWIFYEIITGIAFNSSQSYQKPSEKSEGFFTAFFQLNFLEIPILGLKISP